MKECSTRSSISRTKPREVLDGETLAALTCGGLSVIQKRDGYRFSLDAYLLAAFVDEKPGAHILEIGSGSGVIAMLLAKIKHLKVTGVEVQSDMAAMSRRSVELNGLKALVDVICSDIKDYRGRKVSAVIANPPYRPINTGRLNPMNTRAIARHELRLDLDTLMESTYAYLSRLGRFYCIYPAWRLADLVSAMRSHHLEPKRLTMVHSSLDGPAELCLIMGVKDGGKELKVDAPLCVYTLDGIYSEEMTEVFRTLKRGQAQ